MIEMTPAAARRFLAQPNGIESGVLRCNIAAMG
jgi:hypothetical protein